MKRHFAEPYFFSYFIARVYQNNGGHSQQSTFCFTNRVILCLCLLLHFLAWQFVLLCALHCFCFEPSITFTYDDDVLCCPTRVELSLLPTICSSPYDSHDQERAVRCGIHIVLFDSERGFGFLLATSALFVMAVAVISSIGGFRDA